MENKPAYFRRRRNNIRDNPPKPASAMFTGSGTAVMSTEKLFSVEVSPGLKSAKKSVQFPFGSVLLNVAKSV